MISVRAVHVIAMDRFGLLRAPCRRCSIVGGAPALGVALSLILIYSAS
jgi:hypothetical protein